MIGISYIGIGSWLIDSLKSKPNISLIEDYYTSMGGIMITVGTLCIINTLIGFILLVRKRLFTSVFVSNIIIISLILKNKKMLNSI